MSFPSRRTRSVGEDTRYVLTDDTVTTWAVKDKNTNTIVEGGLDKLTAQEKVNELNNLDELERGM